MAKILELDLENEERLCALGSALSSLARIQILKLLYHNSFNVAEIAEKLQIPTSSAAVYIRSLETAGLINTKMQKGSRGSMKICSRKYDNINITLTADDPDVDKVYSLSIPIGCYSDCEVMRHCKRKRDDRPRRPSGRVLPAGACKRTDSVDVRWICAVQNSVAV